MIAFGPVPSRRLGRSLGINTIPVKACTYSCRYCQVGRTVDTQLEPRTFYAPAEVVRDVEARLARLADRAEEVHVLTIVPDGEPTLDVNLGRTIQALRQFSLPIAVITNASLMAREDVRARLRLADWVSVKVDAASVDTWRKVNRPHPALSLAAIQEGLRAFAQTFAGELVTETMLLDGLNDGEAEVKLIAERVGELAPRRAFLAVPTRPTADAGVRAASEASVVRAYALLREQVDEVVLLTRHEGETFAATGDLVDDLLGATSVHPMREAQVRALVARSGGHASVIDRLVAERRLNRVTYAGKVFYVRSTESR